jgi:hypothetical protein
MAKYLGRWRMTDVCPPIGARPGAMMRQITDDAVRRGRDQAPPALLCTIRQDGQSGNWEGEDGEGRPLTVTTGANGLEI